MEVRREAPESLRFNVAAPQARRMSAATACGMVALVGGLLGLGYHAVGLKSERDAISRELVSTRAEATSLRTQTRAQDEQLAGLRKQGNEAEARLTQANEKLTELGAELAATQTRVDAIDQERSEITHELAEYKQTTAQLKRMIDSGRLKVTFRRGRMIVELPAQVLFPSGSAELTKDGQQALTEVAAILRGLTNRHFIVAGHTDNVPVAGRFASNWELSAGRAVNVTQELVRGGLRPEQLVAAGYGEYDPIARNTSETGRQKNRRIEIILEPRLKPVPELEPKAAK
jgi:chemotaxis protein MotB